MKNLPDSAANLFSYSLAPAGQGCRGLASVGRYQAASPYLWWLLPNAVKTLLCSPGGGEDISGATILVNGGQANFD